MGRSPANREEVSCYWKSILASTLCLHFPALSLPNPLLSTGVSP